MEDKMKEIKMHIKPGTLVKVFNDLLSGFGDTLNYDIEHDKGLKIKYPEGVKVSADFEEIDDNIHFRVYIDGEAVFESVKPKNNGSQEDKYRLIMAILDMAVFGLMKKSGDKWFRDKVEGNDK